MEFNKKGYLKTILITIVAVVLVVIIASIIYVWKARDIPPQEFLKKVIDDVKDIVTPDNNQGSSSSSSSSSSSGGGSSSSSSGGGGGSSSSSSETGENENGCFNQTISYYLINPSKIENCNEEAETICLNKTITCSVDIYNKDSSLSGIFKMEMAIIEDGETRETGLIFLNQSDLLINAQEFAIFKTQATVTSEGEEGIANKAANCFTSTLEVPFREICY